MNVDNAHAHSAQGLAHISEAISRPAVCIIASRRLKDRHNCSNKRGKRKRGARHFQQLTASDDPFITLPVLQNWKGLQRFNTEVSEMDVSEAETDGRYDSDATMKSASDIERSTIDVAVPRAVAKPDVRPRYEPEQPLSNKQLAFSIVNAPDLVEVSTAFLVIAISLFVLLVSMAPPSFVGHLPRPFFPPDAW